MSFFWNGYHLKDFLFKSFDSKSVSGFLGICIALFSVGVLYEGMYFLKKLLFQKFLDKRKLCREERRRRSEVTTSDNDMPSSTYVGSDMNPRDSLLADDEPSENESRGNSRPVQNFEFVYLLIASVIHSIYACVGYTLMNAVMTFNVWILIAVCMGIGVGFLFFRTSGINSDISGDTDDCQTRCSIEATCMHEENGGMCAETYKTDLNKEAVDQVQESEKTSSPRSSSPRAHSSMSNESQNHRRKNSSRAKEEDSNTGPKVLVVGAQVHNNFQESA